MTKGSAAQDAVSKVFQAVCGSIFGFAIDTSSNPGYTIEKGYPEAPSEAIREEYFKYAEQNRYEHQELPGKIGLGVIVKG